MVFNAKILKDTMYGDKHMTSGNTWLGFENWLHQWRAFYVWGWGWKSTVRHVDFQSITLYLLLQLFLSLCLTWCHLVSLGLREVNWLFLLEFSSIHYLSSICFLSLQNVLKMPACWYSLCWYPCSCVFAFVFLKSLTIILMWST